MTDWLLVDTLRRLFSDVATHAEVQRAEREGWSSEVWDPLAEAGFLQLGDLPLTDALSALTVAGEYAAPVPLAESGLLAGWLLDGAIAAGDVVTVVPGRPEDTLALSGGRLSGTAHRVPWGRSANQVVALVGGRVVVVPVSSAQVRCAANLAGEPRDTLVFEGVKPDDVRDPRPGIDALALRHCGALTRAALMAGGLASMLALTQRYTSERRQFGRPVGAFQAVQMHVVSLAQDAALVAIATEHAARAAERGPARFEIASAKLLAAEAVFSATRAAHQAHGAMGMTQEYPLHHFSRRLWAWRSEYGDETFWGRRLGRSMREAGADRLFAAIADGSDAVAE